MNIIDARTGQPISQFPFILGEKGRGRWAERIEPSRRPGLAPTGPLVGYQLLPVTDPKGLCPKNHVILTKANPRQVGTLVRINTLGAYTRGTGGSVELVVGDAKLLTHGWWAWGTAGRVGCGTDELWHVDPKVAVFSVVISGGTRKGMGRRMLIVTPSSLRMWKLERLQVELVSGAVGTEVETLLWRHRDSLPEIEEAILMVNDMAEGADCR